VIGRHDQDIGRPGQAAERVGGHDVRVQRHVGRHFAVILEINPSLIEDVDCLANLAGALTIGLAEGRVGEQGDPRRIAQPARDVGGFLGDVGDLFR